MNVQQLIERIIRDIPQPQIPKILFNEPQSRLNNKAMKNIQAMQKKQKEKDPIMAHLFKYLHFLIC